MTLSVSQTLMNKLDRVDQMPSLPVTLVPLLRYLEQPVDSLEVQKIVEMISQDKSLSAQCLHMANSPLFGRYQSVDTIRGAIMAIGLQRMRDIVLSCSVLKLSPAHQAVINPTVFWEHSFGCALVASHFAQRVKFVDKGKVYLAGLLHDIGLVIHLWLIPKEFGEAFERARTKHLPLEEAERQILGVTHCRSGCILAERWDLAPEIVEVIRHNHAASGASQHRALVALVGLSDLLCRMRGLGYGYTEEQEIDFLQTSEFDILLQECPELKEFDWARFTLELESYVEDVHRLVALLYRSHA